MVRRTTMLLPGTTIQLRRGIRRGHAGNAGGCSAAAAAGGGCSGGGEEEEGSTQEVRTRRVGYYGNVSEADFFFGSAGDDRFLFGKARESAATWLCQQSQVRGEWVGCSSIGANFTPHFITANSGEDVTMKIISFSQQGPRAICILSANVVISSVTLRQPDSSGGTLTYEGRFEILSLSGSFMPNDDGGTRSRSGGMSISLASPDGRVVGGGVAGLLVAASPVQVVVGSFLAGKQQQSNHKKQKFEVISTATPPAAAAAHANLSTCSSWSNPTDISVSFPGG
ncbi:AT-hook motif nuclear-localized protein [Arachis hypogaea]|nr:AT-hook motif nuclear-localized protein [Arachis hypogaea]